MESVGQSVRVTNFPTNCNTYKAYKHHLRRARGEERKGKRKKKRRRKKEKKSGCQTNRKTREYKGKPALPSQGSLKLLDIT